MFVFFTSVSVIKYYYWVFANNLKISHMIYSVGKTSLWDEEGPFL